MNETVRDMVIRYAQKFEGPNDISQAILAEATSAPDALRVLFAEVLPEYCGKILRSQRLDLDREMSETKEGPPVYKSAKDDAIRAWFPRWLDQQLHVAEGWKRMSDCTSEDLMFGAQERRRTAAATERRAAELEALALALETRKLRNVGQLSATVVRAALASAR